MSNFYLRRLLQFSSATLPIQLIIYNIFIINLAVRWNMPNSNNYIPHYKPNLSPTPAANNKS